MKSTAHIGESVQRKEGWSKLTGRARYVDDLVLPDMLYGATIRSEVARGTILGIHFEGDIPWDEFTIVTAKDIPGDNVVQSLTDDQPILAEKKVNHAHEPVVLIAHPDKYLVAKARRHVRLEIQELPSVLDIDSSLAKNNIIFGTDNVIKEIGINKGDVDSVWEQADHIIEGVYTTGASEQLYIENNGMIGEYSEAEGVTVHGSMQCPYYVHPALCRAFAEPEERIRVIQTVTGGGFGGKEDYPSIIACHAALLAKKSGKPVKLVYDREEDFAATTKRHPSKTWHKTAVSKEGRLLAIDIKFVLDGGAYTTLTPVVLSRGTIHAAGPYNCDHIRINGTAVATNHPPHGAYRGFGNPQSLFAMERHIEQIAAQLGYDPIEFRRQNFLEEGDRTATQQVVRDGCSMNGLMDQALAETDFLKKRADYEEHNKTDNPIKKGIGVAAFYHGSGFTGSGEKKLASVAGIEGTPEGKLRVLASSTEIGQGTNTIFSQIVCDTLELPYDMVEVLQPDTKFVPNSGPTVASRTCMVVGKLVQTAAIGLKQALIQGHYLKEPYTAESFSQAIQAYLKERKDLKLYSQYQLPANIRWDEVAYRGEAYASYGWAIYVADLEFDTRTYETHLTDFYALQDVGKVLNPIFAEGQVQGGVAQGIGYALSEKVVYQEGRVINNQMTNYIMPTSVDLPVIRVGFFEAPYAGGPGGAKGVGELPIDGPAPAILNALHQATQLNLTHIPAIPEVIFTEWNQNHDKR